MITEALKLAFAIGIDPASFWKLTPWQFNVCVDGYRERKEQDHDHAVWTAWQGAYFQRAKKMPPVKDYFSSSKKQVKKIDETGIITRLKAYQKKVKDGPSS